MRELAQLHIAADAPMRKRIWAISAVVAFTLVATVTHSVAAPVDETVSNPQAQPAGPALPWIIERQMERLGPRMAAGSKARLVLTGTFSPAKSTPVPAQIMYQWPNLFKFQTSGSEPAALTFDGKDAHSKKSSLDTTDQNLLESLLDDSPDGLFASLMAGSSLRLIGRRFHPAPSVSPSYNGPSFDIYESVGPVLGRQGDTHRSKRFYFDSKSGFLLSVRYDNAAKLKTETRFVGWRDVAGTAVADRIERWENGDPVFTFDLLAAQVLADAGTSDIVVP